MTPEEIPALFQKQKTSRRKTVPGDVFSIKIPDGYLLGRVVANNAKSSPWDEPQLQLLYIYAGVRKDLKSVTAEDFRPPNLLIPPVLTNRMGWTRGYYETLTNIPLESADLLKRHVFREPGKQNYWDENSEPVEESDISDASLVGLQALQSYFTTEDRISRALGLGPTID